MSESRPTALAAFLRSIEPRARVLAQAQAGPALDAEALLAAVRSEFAERAPRLPLAEWPLRYWGQLLAGDALVRPPEAPPAHPLYALSPTRRMALLLRLVVGLEPSGAARVMGLSPEAFSTLFADAEDKLASLGVGPAVLMRWQDEFQAAVREAAAGRAAPSPAPAGAPKATGRGKALPPRPRWRPSGLQWALGLVALLLLAVLAATFVWPPGAPPGPASAAALDPRPAPLPTTAPPAPAERGPREADLQVDPDLALVAEPAEAPWRRELSLAAWWVAQRGALPPVPAEDRTPPPADWAALPEDARRLLAPVQAVWPALDAEARAGLLENVQLWSAADPARRAELLESYRRWRALPARERSEQRAAFARWRALDAAEREALAAALPALEALPEAEREALAARFEALDPAERADWALGPRLGAQLPALRPLLAFLPAGEQAVLIEAFDGLDEAQRRRLGERVAAMGVAERAALRGRVLAAEPEARVALLAAAAEPR